MADITTLSELRDRFPLVRAALDSDLATGEDEQHLGRLAYDRLLEYLRALLVQLRAQRVPLLQVPAWLAGRGLCSPAQVEVLLVMLGHVRLLEGLLTAMARQRVEVPINRWPCAA